MTETTEIILAGGIRQCVEGNAEEVARVIIDASRGSIMELAWLVDAETGERIALNPASVVSLRQVGS